MDPTIATSRIDADAPGLFVADHPRYVPSEFTRGPWRPDAQHGGPPAALLAHVSEPLVEPGEFLTHIEVELIRPVPLTPLRCAATRERVSGRVFRIQGEMYSGGDVVARSNALVLRCMDIPTPDFVAAPEIAPEPPDQTKVVEPPRWASGDLTTYHRNAVEHRFTSGTFREPGPAVDWIRLRQPVVRGVEPSGLQRVLAAADFGSGISVVFGDESTFGMINVNLTVALIREPKGEWISLDATTQIGAQGTGLCIATLGDANGHIGVATQSLLGYTLV